MELEDIVERSLREQPILASRTAKLLAAARSDHELAAGLQGLVEGYCSDLDDPLVAGLVAFAIDEVDWLGLAQKLAAGAKR